MSVFIFPWEWNTSWYFDYCLPNCLLPPRSKWVSETCSELKSLFFKCCLKFLDLKLSCHVLLSHSLSSVDLQPCIYDSDQVWLLCLAEDHRITQILVSLFLKLRACFHLCSSVICNTTFLFSFDRTVEDTFRGNLDQDIVWGFLLCQIEDTLMKQNSPENLLLPSGVFSNLNFCFKCCCCRISSWKNSNACSQNYLKRQWRQTRLTFIRKCVRMCNIINQVVKWFVQKLCRPCWGRFLFFNKETKNSDPLTCLFL